MHIHFTDLERWAMWEQAKLRQSKKTKYARDKRNDTTMDNVEMHYIGIKGEYAVARYLGVSYDRSVLAGGPDLTYAGKTIEVKVSQELLIFTPGTFHADLAVLVNPDKNSPHDKKISKPAHAYQDVCLIGWTSYDHFVKYHFRRDFGYGVRYCLAHRHLRKMPTLKHARS